jgi:photosystem II stability/assembly factor-like uncharacterized protein
MKKILFLITTLICIVFHNICAQQWKDVTPPGYETSSGCFINKSQGWVVSRNPNNNFYTLLYTSNGASSFKERYTFLEEGIGFYQIQMVDSLIGYSTTWDNDSLFLKTTDGGYSWKDITDTSIMEKDYNNAACYFLNADTGFYGGINSIYKTLDGGVTWTKMNTPVTVEPGSNETYFPNSIFLINAQFGWAVCSYAIDAGFGMKTIDGGQNWEICTSTGSTDMCDVHFINNQTGGMVGRNAHFSHVYLTEKNFITFSLLNQNWYDDYGQFANTICYQNDTTIWISGFPAKLFRSTDRGINFIEFQNMPYTSGIRDIQFWGSTGYVLGNRFLLKFEDSTNGITTQENDLQIKIYPNPVIDKLHIRLNCLSPEVVTIALLSLNGKLVEQIQTYALPGNNEIEINTNTLNAGIYILSAVGAGYNKHEKVIIQRQ